MATDPTLTPPSVASVPSVDLGGGVAMPVLGLGTWPMDDGEAERAVGSALRLGWRLVDTAENYGNERGVGRAIGASGVPRDEIFVTSKFNRRWHSADGPRRACEASLARLGLDRLDLLLIHWPNPDQDRFVEAFEAMLRLRESGLVRAVGVSNFKPAHLQRLFDRGLVPQVNQIQLDPHHRRDDLVAIHHARGIVTQAWRPLGKGAQAGALLDDAAVAAVARRLGRTPAQVVLRWAIERGHAVVAKSSDPARQAENLAAASFPLDADDRSALGALDALGRDDPAMLDADRFGH